MTGSDSCPFVKIFDRDPCTVRGTAGRVDLSLVTSGSRVTGRPRRGPCTERGRTSTSVLRTVPGHPLVSYLPPSPILRVDIREDGFGVPVTEPPSPLVFVSPPTVLYSPGRPRDCKWNSLWYSREESVVELHTETCPG